MGSMLSRLLQTVMDALVTRIVNAISPPNTDHSLTNGEISSGRELVAVDLSVSRLFWPAQAPDPSMTDARPSMDSFVMCPQSGYCSRVKKGYQPWMAETWRAAVHGAARNVRASETWTHDGQVATGDNKSPAKRKLSGLVRGESLPATPVSTLRSEAETSYHRAVSV